MSACEKAGLAVTLDQWGQRARNETRHGLGCPGPGVRSPPGPPGVRGCFIRRRLPDVPRAGRSAARRAQGGDRSPIVDGRRFWRDPSHKRLRHRRRTGLRGRARHADSRPGRPGRRRRARCRIALRSRIRPARLRPRRQHDPHARARRPRRLRIGPRRPASRDRVRNSRRSPRPVHACRRGRPRRRAARRGRRSAARGHRSRIRRVEPNAARRRDRARAGNTRGGRTKQRSTPAQRRTSRWPATVFPPPGSSGVNGNL